MPKFEVLSKSEAELKTATGKRAELTKEYLGYIQGLRKDQAGKLTATGDGESIASVRRRLGSAARAAGKDLVIKRTGNDLYFWLANRVPNGRRRGRPRKTETSS